MPKRDIPQGLQLTRIGESGPNASNKLAVFSAKASAVTAAKMLDFVREMSLGSEDFTQRQADYWIFILQDYAPSLIEQAFHQWVKRSKHMPVPSEIVEILDALVEKDRQHSVTRRTEQYVSELRETRRQLADAGQPCGEAQYHGLIKKALETIKQFPAPPDPNRFVAFRERLARAEKERAAKRRPVANVHKATQDTRQANAHA